MMNDKYVGIAGEDLQPGMMIYLNSDDQLYKATSTYFENDKPVQWGEPEEEPEEIRDPDPNYAIPEIDWDNGFNVIRLEEIE